MKTAYKLSIVALFILFPVAICTESGLASMAMIAALASCIVLRLLTS